MPDHKRKKILHMPGGLTHVIPQTEEPEEPIYFTLTEEQTNFVDHINAVKLLAQNEQMEAAQKLDLARFALEGADKQAQRVAILIVQDQADPTLLTRLQDPALKTKLEYVDDNKSLMLTINPPEPPKEG